MEVRGQDQIGPFGNEERQTSRQFERTAPKSPASEPTARAGNLIVRTGGATAGEQTGKAVTASSAQHSRTTHAAGETRQRVSGIALACGAGRIEKEQAVVYDGAGRRPEVDGPQ